MRYFTEFSSFASALRKSGCRYSDTFCGRIFIAIFAKVMENECIYIMHRQLHVTGFRHYNITYSLLLLISNSSLIFPWWNVCKLLTTFVIWSLNLVILFLFQHLTASICVGIYAQVYCILYCVYDVVVGKTTEWDPQANPASNPNPKSYLLAVQYGGLASS